MSLERWVAAALGLGWAVSPAGAREPIRIETREERLAGGPVRIFVARVALRDRHVAVRVTGPAARPGDPSGTEAHLETVPEWMKREGAALAVNANFFGKLAGAPERWTVDQPVDILGPSVSEGRVVSHANANGLGHPALLLNLKRQARIACALESDLRGSDDVVAGISDPQSGGCLLVEKGENHGANAPERLRARHPRTAAGVTRDGRELILVVVDGRQPGWSIGMTLEELGALLLRLGAHDGINLDGGGSSSFLFHPAKGAAVENRPSDGAWRPVANHLGIVLRAN